MSNFYNDMAEQVKQDKLMIAQPNKLKMYILVRETIPLGLAMAAVAHAAIACWDEYVMETEMESWFEHSFRKVICKVNDREFEKAKALDRNVVMTESALDNQETAIALCPREEWPKFMKFLRLYK